MLVGTLVVPDSPVWVREPCRACSITTLSAESPLYKFALFSHTTFESFQNELDAGQHSEYVYIFPISLFSVGPFLLPSTHMTFSI